MPKTLSKPSTKSKRVVEIVKKSENLAEYSKHINLINTEIDNVNNSIFINNNTLIDMQNYSLTTISSNQPTAF